MSWLLSHLPSERIARAEKRGTELQRTAARAGRVTMNLGPTGPRSTPPVEHRDVARVEAGPGGLGGSGRKPEPLEHGPQWTSDGWFQQPC